LSSVQLSGGVPWRAARSVTEDHINSLHAIASSGVARR
jgi:hypothetical protein